MKKYSVMELVNNVCERSFRSSSLNLKKIENCGFENGEPIKLFGSFTMRLYASHGGIRKVFFKGSREVKKETVMKNYRKAGVQDVK